MIAPEDDYESWIMIAASTVEDPCTFEQFLPDIERIMESIQQTDDLPPGLEGKKSDFVVKLQIEIIRKILQLGDQDDESIQIVISFLKKIISFSLYGIEKQDHQIIGYAYYIFNRQDHQLYSSNYKVKIFQLLAKHAVECGLYQKAFELIIKKPDNFISLSTYFTICTACVSFQEETKFSDIAISTVESIKELVKSNLRAAPTSSITYIFDISRSNSLNDETIDLSFFTNWLDLCEMFILGDIFEKQFTGYQYIKTLISEIKIQPVVINWFKEQKHQKIIEPKELHQEFMGPYSEIASVLINEDIISDENIVNLWELHKVQHSTDLAKFFSMFEYIGKNVISSRLTYITRLCLNIESTTEHWVLFIWHYGEIVGRRTEGRESLVLIREKLWELLETSDEQFKDVLTRAFSTILQYHLTPDDFVEWIDKIMMNGPSIPAYMMLQEAISACRFPDEESAFQLVKATVDFVISNQVSRDVVYGFLFKLCFSNNVKLPEEQLPSLFSLSQECTFFYSFAKSMIESELVSYDFIENYIHNIEADQINSEFVSLMISFIKKVNQYNETLYSLPIQKEYLVWNLASIESNERQSIAEFICELYSSNDGETLSDPIMMKTFINQWTDQYHKVQDKTGLIILMTTFITIIENVIDIDYFNVKRHDPNYEKNKTTVEVNTIALNMRNQVHILPDTTTIQALTQRISRISRIPSSQITLQMYNNVLNPKQTLGQLANQENVVKVFVSLLSNYAVLRERHQRTCVPSTILAQSPIVDEVFELLKENNEEAKKLLNYLPTRTKTLLKIKEITKRNSFDYQEIFPRDAPQLFKYSFDAVLKLYNEKLQDHLDRTNGFTYLIETVPLDKSFLLIPRIIAFLDNQMSENLKIKYAQTLFLNIFPSLTNLSNNDHKILFSSTVKFLRSIANLKDVKLDITEEFQGTIHFLLFNELEFVRTESSELLCGIPIPLSMLTKFLHDELDPHVANELFKAMVPHVNEYSEILVNMVLKKQTPNLLKILEKMLKQKLVPEEMYSEITDRFIELYLTPDARSRDKECYTLALECLADIQNDTLLDQLILLHTDREMYKDWKIDGDATTVSSTGYSGLVNLGATCFLNSTLQQFFWIPELRKAIIEFNGDNSFLCELRNLFAKLLLSNGHSVNTAPLVSQWTGWGNEKMNPHVQQDACEFVQMLIDKLETGLSHDLVNRLFNGTTIDHFEGISDEYHSERSQPFCTFGLPIVESKNVEEAFQKFQAPDYFTGTNQYLADTLDKKIDAKKYASLGTLPEYLIIQLSRFDFNYYTMQRIKIDKQFDFSLDLDVAPYTDGNDTNTKYKLQGVIVHSGSADCGHYFSYVNNKSDNKWYNFNDSYVSEITVEKMMNSATGQKNYTNGYLLFYKRTDVNDDIPEIFINDELKQEINAENNLYNEYMLYCSSAYFNFMKQIANSDNTNYQFIAIQYYFDTLPFTTHINHAKEISTTLVRKLKENHELRISFLDFLNTCPFSCSLVYCPEESVRLGAKEMISTLDITEFVFERIFNIIDDDITPYYRCLNEFFELLSFIIERNENLHVYAIQRQWVERVSMFYIDGIQIYLNDHPEIRREYFFGGFNLSGILNLIAKLEPTDRIIEYSTEENNFKLLLMSLTSVDAIVNLLKSMPNAEATIAFLIQFCEKSSIFVDYFKLLPIIFKILGSQGFDLVRKSRFKIADKSSTNLDYAFAILVMVRNHNLLNIFMENLEEWLFQLLFDNLETRYVTGRILSIFVPHRLFEDFHTFSITHKSQKSFGDIEFIPQEMNEETIYRANHILEFLINNIDQAISVIISHYSTRITCNAEYSGETYLRLLRVFSEITGRNINDSLMHIANSIRSYAQSYDYHMVTILDALLKSSMELDSDMIYSFFTKWDSVKQTTGGMFFIMDTIIPYIDVFRPPVEFIKHFLDLYPFTKSISLLSSHKTTVISLLKHFAALEPELTLKYLQDNFERISKNNYSCLLIALQTIDKKMPIFDSLNHAISVNQFLSIDTLVKLTIQFNEGEIKDTPSLISLLNSPEIGKEARTAIWEIVYELKPAFDTFCANYHYRGDWIQLTNYLLSLEDINAGALLLEAASNSLEAFTLSFEWLVVHMKENILDSLFSRTILSQQIYGNEEVIVKYLRFLFEGHGVEEDIEIMSPMVKEMLVQVEFFYDVLQDVYNNSITKEDMFPLFGPLKVISQIHIGDKAYVQQLGKLQYIVKKKEVKETVNIPEYDELERLLRHCILV